MSTIERFYGSPAVVRTLEGMIGRDRIPQTILVSGPEGVGKATLARRFATALIGDAAKIERDDLSLPENDTLIRDREKWASDKRSDDPLLFSSHPDFVSFPPDGPLKQISIQQMRELRERANFKPLKGRYRVFLIDRLDRANEQAANSLLKTLEEPPDHLIIIATAQNPYDLLPTIRSRAVMLQLTPLSQEEMAAFAKERGLAATDRRIPLASGRPGLAITLDLELYDKRRNAMLRLLNVASGRAQFSDWAKVADAVGAGRSDKLDSYLEVLYVLIGDLVALQNGMASIRNADIRNELTAIAKQVDFEWLRKAVAKLDELVEFQRRNIQKSIALDALVIALRPA